MVGSDAAAWDVVRSPRPAPVRGVRIAGFRSLSADPIAQRVIPHPSITVILEFGDSSLLVEDATGRQQNGSLAAGLAHHPAGMRGRNIACLELRISPVVAHTVLGACLTDPESMVDLDAVWGRETSRIRQQLNEATSWSDRFTVADTFLTRRIAAGPPMAPEVIWAWERIAASRGRVRVDDLAVELGWSRKRLWTRFRSQVGVAPKRAAKLMRFHHAAHHLTAGRSTALVAAECGYTDQSHLHRDVSAFTGTTPTALAGNSGLAATHLAFEQSPSAHRFVPGEHSDRPRQ
ncbi:helix-turn-helix domain-containing protein [Nocardia sp. NPDC006044]|uniref:helix-turn-helix domain-containing protein n=1 Tax=Nocardia sp. NPDC006044 TaxID=3364306 RepID=UPI003683FDC7